MLQQNFRTETAFVLKVARRSGGRRALLKTPRYDDGTERERRVVSRE